MHTPPNALRRSDFIHPEQVLRTTAFAACGTVLAMIATFVATGVGQDPLQFVHPSAAYTSLLLRGPTALRATLALDHLFIAFYATAFASLAVVLVRRGASKLLVGVSTTLLLVLAGLDLAENLHFLLMLDRAELGLAPTEAEIAAQVFESLVKFHVSYVGLFLLSFVLPGRTAPERWLRGLSRYLQLPVGVLIYVTPHAVAFPLVIVRFSYFVASLALLGLALGGRGDREGDGISPSRGAAGSGAPA